MSGLCICRRNVFAAVGFHGGAPFRCALASTGRIACKYILKIYDIALAARRAWPAAGIVVKHESRGARGIPDAQFWPASSSDIWTPGPMQGRRKSAARIIREKTPLVLKERGAVASNCPRNDFQGVGDHFRCHFRNVSRKSGVLGEPFRPSDRVPQEKKTCALAGMAKRSVSSTPASMGRIFFRNASVGSPPQSLAGRCVDALAARHQAIERTIRPILFSRRFPAIFRRINLNPLPYSLQML